MASRDLSKAEIEGFGFLVGWFEEWRVRAGLPPGRQAAEHFWREAVKSKERENWQLEQWAVALGWYLRWMEFFFIWKVISLKFEPKDGVADD